MLTVLGLVEAEANIHELLHSGFRCSRVEILHVCFRSKHGAAGGGGGGGVLVVACLSHLTIDHESLLRRSTVPTPNRDNSNIWALITLLPYTK